LTQPDGVEELLRKRGQIAKLSRLSLRLGKVRAKAATIYLKLQIGQCNNERLTAVQSPASAAHSDQTQITSSSHHDRAPSGTDSIEWPDFELFRTRNINVIAFFRAKQSGPKFLDPPFLRAVTWVDPCWGKFEGLAR